MVWEETIIFLPRQTRMVFLSATLSNSTQFAGWVTHLHAQPCHVVYTDTRPTPLQHYLYPKGGEGLHLVRKVIGGHTKHQKHTKLNAVMASFVKCPPLTTGEERAWGVE